MASADPLVPNTMPAIMQRPLQTLRLQPLLCRTGRGQRRHVARVIRPPPRLRRRPKQLRRPLYTRSVNKMMRFPIDIGQPLRHLRISPPGVLARPAGPHPQRIATVPPVVHRQRPSRRRHGIRRRHHQRRNRGIARQRTHAHRRHVPLIVVRDANRLRRRCRRIDRRRRQRRRSRPNTSPHRSRCRARRPVVQHADPSATTGRPACASP